MVLEPLVEEIEEITEELCDNGDEMDFLLDGEEGEGSGGEDSGDFGLGTDLVEVSESPKSERAVTNTEEGAGGRSGVVIIETAGYLDRLGLIKVI